MGEKATTVTVRDGVVEVTTTETVIEQKPVDDYRAELTERLAQLTANRDSYDPLIVDVQAKLDAVK